MNSHSIRVVLYITLLHDSVLLVSYEIICCRIWLFTSISSLSSFWIRMVDLPAPIFAHQ